MSFLVSLANMIGVQILCIVESIGRWGVFIFDAITKSFIRPIFKKIFISHIINMGFYSLPLIGLTSLFSGAVLALQSYAGFSRFSAETTIPSIVILSLTRELVPVLSGLVIAGRVGASMAAEIATMRVSEQIDALYTLSTDSIKYLITPRVVACCICLPLLDRKSVV